MRQLLQSISKKLFLIIICYSPMLHAQQRMEIEEYIETYKNIAISEMRASGIPASIKMAQAILESGFGNSELAVYANNHFGIKCHGWPGLTYTYTDDEPDECFRKYSDPIDSFYDHTAFLTSRPWYAFLFDLNQMDYKAWAHGLSQAGYATNPRYPELLINIIERHSLYRLDQKAADPVFAVSVPDRGNNLRQPAQGSIPGRENFAPILASRQRQIGTFNRINYVVARDGDTPQLLEQEMDIRAWQIRRYNDLVDDRDIEAGQRIYLQPKRRKGPVEYHIVRAGETMASISQVYGIRMENLYRRNDMTFGMEPRPGQRILLQGYKGSVFGYLFRRP